MLFFVFKKAKHRKLLDFLNEGEDADFDNMDVNEFINTKIENLEKLKFDKTWQIDPTHFYIDGKCKY